MLTGLRYRGKLRKLEAISLKISMILYIARVFRSNFLDMNSFIKLRKPFGQTIIISIFIDVCTIEFRKKSLSRTYLLVWLTLKFKYHSSEDVDSVVSTENPDKNQDPICYRIISRFMLNGPCGAVNPKA
jgi:hypothetical protein